MLKLSAAYHQARKNNPSGHPDVSETAVRDDLMGRNVAWLANNYYKGRKIILWEATMHAVYDAPKIKHPQVQDFYKGTVTCGNVAKEILGDDLYTIGFIAGQGRAGNVFMSSSFDIGPPAADSLEAVCMMTGPLPLHQL